jgi:tRNA nucleotidyltransferase/poly(A) polymerase
MSNWTRSAPWLFCATLALGVAPLTGASAQNPAMDELRGKIFDARMAEKTFVNGLKFCDELDGKGFYFQMRNRVLMLDEYFHSLENLVKAQVYNPQKRRPWSVEDAKERWEEVKKQAQEDKDKCALVRSLPQLEKQLRDLESKAATSDKPDKKN